MKELEILYEEKLNKSSYNQNLIYTPLTSDKANNKVRKRNIIWFHLTHFSPMSHFYIPWKRQKTYGFLTFSGVIEV